MQKIMKITNSKNELTMSSREIAELTDSSHDNVLKTIRSLFQRGVVSGNETPYIHPQNGQTYSEFNLSYRDTMVVVSGYSAELRAKIIDRWQELEASIPDPLAELTHDQRMLVETIIRQNRIEKEQAKQAEQIRVIEAKQSAFEEGSKFFTVLAYCNLNNIKVSLPEAAKIGKLASKLSRENGIMIDTVRDPRFGQVNQYHESMIAQAVEEMYEGM